jgi:Concanavalin A-like lectin/glucanases superfamily
MLKIPLPFLFAEHLQGGPFRRLREVKLFLGFCAVLLAHGLTTGAANAQLQNGLVGYWSFDEGSGFIASDSSDNDRPGTLVHRPHWVASGAIAGALSFDGVNDYVIFGFEPHRTISISAWVYAQGPTDDPLPRIIEVPGYVLFLAQPGAPGSHPMSLGFQSRRSGQGGRWRTPANSMAYNSWHHIAVVYNSSSTLNNPDLYINGVRQTISELQAPQGTQTFIGVNAEVGIIGKGWDGLIDEVRIHNRALTAAEIGSLYGQGNNDPFNFSLANSTSLSVAKGASATNTITANLITGSPEAVSFSTSALPAGASASFSRKTCSPSCSSLLTIATAASTPAGAYTVSVTGAGGGVKKTTSFTLMVTSATSVAITSPAQGTTFAPGQTVTATGSGTNLRWAIDLWSEGLPAFKTGTGSSITFTVPASANSSQFIRITLTGTGGSATRDYDIASSAAFNFSLSNGGNQSVTQGQSVASTITASLSSGSSKAVSFSTAGLPAGATASYTTSTSCNPTCSRTLNIATAASTPAGTYTVSVTGAGGGVTKTTSFSLSVTAAASTPVTSGASVAITSPAQGTTLTPGQTVTATGSGTNLSWYVDRWLDGLPSFKTGTGSSITFTVPVNTTSGQIIRITLTGSGGLATRDYNIATVSPAPTSVKPIQLTLFWNDNSNNEDHFAIERKTGANGTYTQIALTAANSTSYVDTAVIKEVTYCYRVRAVDGAVASAYSPEACGAAR